MGVPRQVAEMEAASEKNLAEDAAATASAGAETPEAATEPGREEAQKTKAAAEKPDAEGEARILDHVGDADGATGGDLEALKLENQRMRSMMGRLGKAKREREDEERRNAEAAAKLAESEAEVARLKAELESARSAGGAGKAKMSDDLRSNLRSKLGDGYSDEEIDNFAAAVNEIAGAETRDIREKMAAREKAEAQSAAANFKAKLEAEFPGFVKMDAESDPTWTKFLGSSLGGVMEGTTYGEVAAMAARRLDYRKFASVVREFQKATGTEFSRGGTTVSPDVAAQMRPATAGGAVRPDTGKMPEIYARSEIAAFARAYQARRAEETYGLTSEQVAERIRRYEDAEAEGRVDERR